MGFIDQRIITLDAHYFNQRERAEEQVKVPQLDPPLDEAHQDQEPTSNHPQSIPLHVPRTTNPINEFTFKDENFYGTFPTLFPLGCGCCKPGSIPKADAKHMLNQHSAIF